MYFSAPAQYNVLFIICCFLITCISIAKYFKFRSKYGYSALDFEPVFIIISILVIYVFPIFIYDPSDDNSAYMFSFFKKFSLDYINKGVVYASIGITAFTTGCSIKYQTNETNEKLRIDSSLLAILTIFIVCVYLALGGFKHYQNIYQN